MIFVVWILMFLPLVAEASSGVGSISYTSGRVWVQHDGVKEVAERGRILLRHDIVVTGSRSRAKLIMNDGSRVYVGSRSRVGLQKYSMKGKSLLAASFNMFWGKARFFVNKLVSTGSSFNVRTPTAVLGVRGTSFFVDQSVPINMAQFESLSTDFEAFSKQVRLPMTVTLVTGGLEIRVQGQKPVLLAPGYTADISGEGVTKVSKTKAGTGSAPEVTSQDSDSSQDEGGQGDDKGDAKGDSAGTDKESDEGSDASSSDEPSADKQSDDGSDTSSDTQSEASTDQASDTPAEKQSEASPSKPSASKSTAADTAPVQQLPEPPTLQQVSGVSAGGGSVTGTSSAVTGGTTGSSGSASGGSGTNISNTVNNAVNNAIQNLGTTTDINVQTRFVAP